MVPLHLRKKLRTEKPKPKHFEVMPPIGSLMPGQRINVQVKFMPTEEVRGGLKDFWLEIRSMGNLRASSLVGERVCSQARVWVTCSESLFGVMICL